MIDDDKPALTIVPPQEEDDADLQLRLDIDEAEIRASFDDGPLGADMSDYREVWNLFRRLKARIDAIDADPSAMLDDLGRHDFAALKVWQGIVGTGAKLVFMLNKMRASDRLVESIITFHTQSFAQGLAREIAGELQTIRDLALSNGPAAANEINALLEERFPVVFRAVASEAHLRTRDRFKLTG